METLLKKAWESVSNRSISISEKMQGGAGVHASTGSFNRVPDEIFILILKSLGPKEAAKLAVVCKTWRTIVSDNRLWMYFFQSNERDSWDSIFFAEAHLRFGYPLQKFCNQTPQLSYKRIYGQRAQVPVSVIIDGGSGYCKFGWSKDRCPSGRSATFLEFGNIESPMYSRLRHFFATIYNRMQTKPTNQPIVVVTPICHYDVVWGDGTVYIQQNTVIEHTCCWIMHTDTFGFSDLLTLPCCTAGIDTESDKASRRQLKEAIYSALFDLNVPAVCTINQATLALYAARQASGIVVNIGFQQTSVVPILHGKVMCNVGVEIVGMGASKLTGFLREQMQQMNIHFESLYTIRELKEKLCYVALDYEAELSKDTQASYKVSREGTFTLSKERFQAGEILFQPRIAGVRAMGLHQAVALCIDHCHDAELMCDDSWFKTVVLSGGTACLPGLPGRLEKELRELLPPSMASQIRVIPPPFGVDSAWFGAKAISNLSTFPGTWCVTKKQFKYKFRKNLIGPW